MKKLERQKIMTELEKYLFDNHEKVTASKNYITDGTFLFSKDFLNNSFLRAYETTSVNLINLFSNKSGEDYCIDQIGKLAVLLPNNCIGIKYNDKWAFDYRYVSMLYDFLKYEDAYTTVVKDGLETEEKEKAPILKFFSDEDKLIAALLPTRIVF